MLQQLLKTHASQTPRPRNWIKPRAPQKKSSSQSLTSSKYNKAHLNKNTANEIKPSKPLASSGSYIKKYNSHSPTTNYQLSKQTTAKPKHNFQSMLKEKKNSWNALNESTSQSSEEEQLSKPNLSSEPHEQPIYIFHKVKGHSDNPYNNRCDTLAREAIKRKS